MSRIFVLIAATGLVLTPLGILLWLGKRERRRVSTVADPELGNLGLYKAYWEISSKQLVSGQALEISGSGGSGPTPVQRATLAFVKTNAPKLFDLATAAAKSELQDVGVNDLAVADLFLHDEPGSFEFIITSESCQESMPDGISVIFCEEKMIRVEMIH